MLVATFEYITSKIGASLGYPENYNLAIFVLIALRANVVNIPRSRSPGLTAITVFGPFRLRYVNDSGKFPDTSGLKIPTSQFREFGI